jgi:hypothetical protein
VIASSRSIAKVAETLKPTKEGVSEVIETSRLVRVTIWGETDGLLLSRDRFIKIAKVAETLKPTLEGVSEVIETSRLVRVTIWGETDGLLLSRDRFIKIARSPRRSNRRRKEFPRLLRRPGLSG